MAWRESSPRKRPPSSLLSTFRRSLDLLGRRLGGGEEEPVLLRAVRRREEGDQEVTSKPRPRSPRQDPVCRFKSASRYSGYFHLFVVYFLEKADLLSLWLFPSLFPHCPSFPEGSYWACLVSPAPSLSPSCGRSLTPVISTWPPLSRRSRDLRGSSSTRCRPDW